MVYERLHQDIVHMRWGEIEATLATNQGKEMAKEAFKADLPLHMAIERKAPDRVVLELIKANQDAVMVEGKQGNLPLHLAAQNNMSSKVINALIRAFPEALDELNGQQITPRDFPIRSAKVKELLMRPTACWVETVEREEYYERKRQKIRQLNEKVTGLREALARAQHSRETMEEKIAIVEPMIVAQEKANRIASKQETKVNEIETAGREQLKFVKQRLGALHDDVLKEVTPEELKDQSIKKREHVVTSKDQYEQALSSSEALKKDVMRLKIKARMVKAAQATKERAALSS
jgi:hypothetical protein